jgi:hypothetical protein
MHARQLTVLRIDDRTDNRAAPDVEAPSDDQDRPPEGIDVVQFGNKSDPFIAITGWDLAIEYWRSDPANRHPDLVVADVLFDQDPTTPLNWTAEDNLVPTGLLHIKPFAAVSRVIGVPIGIALHTANPGLWENLIIRDGPGRRMALLAAHEIGELAAILDDSENILDLPLEERIRWCWLWLHSRSRGRFRPALAVALENYRSRMVQLARGGGADADPRKMSIMVLPQEWVRLSHWCEEMARTPRPLGEANPALTYIRRDGIADCVSVISLFADVRDDLCDIITDVLPQTCFDVLPMNQAWKLDEQGYPRIGGFLHELKHLKSAVDEAVSILQNNFPPFPARLEIKLSQAGGSASATLARGLAILFQVIWRDQENFKTWSDYFKDYEWDVDHFEFKSSRTTSTSLREVWRTLEAYIVGHGTHFFVDDVFEEAEAEILQHVPTAARRWYFDLLLRAGVVRPENSVGDQRTFWSTGMRVEVPPVPDVIPRGIQLLGIDTKGYLRDVFGFGVEFGPAKSNDDNVIGRLLDAAFGSRDTGDPKEGRQFLSNFLEGNTQPWIAEVCRDFAFRVLSWRDSTTWPRYLRGGANSSSWDK